MGKRKKNTSNKKRKSNKKFKGSRGSTFKANRCANPYGLEGHVGHNLRKISKILNAEFLELKSHAKICCNCRKHDAQNRAKKNSKKTNSDHGNKNQNPAESNDSELIFNNLKAGFSSLEENDPLRVRILTLVPNHWTLQKTADEFGTTIHYVRRARKLLASDDLLAEVPAKLGKTLPESTSLAVSAFYNNDEVSRMMSSVKDCVSMIINGQKQRVQKRMLLLSLKELYVLFKNDHPNVQISFSMFAKLRPKNCILPGQSGTHSVCVCTIHQNVKTMLDAIDLKNLTATEETKLTDYKDCIREIVCSEASDDCFLEECYKCPGVEKL